MRIGVVKQDFCGAIALMYFAENCLDFPQRYLKNEDSSKLV